MLEMKGNKKLELAMARVGKFIFCRQIRPSKRNFLLVYNKSGR